MTESDDYVSDNSNMNGISEQKQLKQQSILVIGLEQYMQCVAGCQQDQCNMQSGKAKTCIHEVKQTHGIATSCIMCQTDLGGDDMQHMQKAYRNFGQFGQDASSLASNKLIICQPQAHSI